MRGAIPPLRNPSSWRGTYLNTGTTLPFYHVKDEVIPVSKNHKMKAIYGGM